MSSYHSTPSDAGSWVLDRGEATEMRIDTVEAGAGMRTLGETYTYSLVLHDRWSSRRPSDVNQRYQELLDRGRHADAFEIHRFEEKDYIGFTPTWPTATDVPPLARLEPTQPHDSTVPGVWGLIEDVSIEDVPLPPGDHSSNATRVSVDLVYLAHSDEYESHADIQQSIGYPGLL